MSGVTIAIVSVAPTQEQTRIIKSLRNYGTNTQEKKQGYSVTFKEDKKMITRICPKCGQVFFADHDYEYSVCQDCHNKMVQAIINYFAELNVGGKHNDD